MPRCYPSDMLHRARPTRQHLAAYRPAVHITLAPVSSLTTTTGHFLGGVITGVQTASEGMNIEYDSYTRDKQVDEDTAQIDLRQIKSHSVDWAMTWL